MPPKPTKGNASAASTAEASSAQTPVTKESTKQMNSNAHPHQTPSLVIGETTILQDEDGRYSLNDLHAAAGGEAKHTPWRWLRNQQALDLIDEIERELTTQNPVLTDLIRAVKTTEGRYGGSFVVKELVYAYAMWISAAFALKVIRSYDAMMTSGKTHNLSADMSVGNWMRLVSLRKSLMKELSICTDVGVAEGIYGNLLHVSRLSGMATPAPHRLAPGLRQQLLALEGGAA